MVTVQEPQVHLPEQELERELERERELELELEQELELEREREREQREQREHNQQLNYCSSTKPNQTKIHWRNHEKVSICARDRG